MEPRWEHAWLHTRRYVGGYERFDLWIERTYGVIAVWGVGVSNWHWVSSIPAISTDHFGPLKDPPTEQELEGIRLYLKLFVPEVPDGT